MVVVGGMAVVENADAVNDDVVVAVDDDDDDLVVVLAGLIYYLKVYQVLKTLVRPKSW